MSDDKTLPPEDKHTPKNIETPAGSQNNADTAAGIGETESTDYRPANRFDASVVRHLSDMYQNWFLDYASYVILERAVPHVVYLINPFCQYLISNNS